MNLSSNQIVLTVIHALTTWGLQLTRSCETSMSPEEQKKNSKLTDFQSVSDRQKTNVERQDSIRRTRFELDSSWKSLKNDAGDDQTGSVSTDDHRLQTHGLNDSSDCHFRPKSVVIGSYDFSRRRLLPAEPSPTDCMVDFYRPKIFQDFVRFVDVSFSQIKARNRLNFTGLVFRQAPPESFRILFGSSWTS
jgi:hypothetical protein